MNVSGHFLCPSTEIKFNLRCGGFTTLGLTNQLNQKSEMDKVIDLSQEESDSDVEVVIDDNTHLMNWVATMFYGHAESYSLEELEAGITKLREKTVFGIVGKEVCPSTKRKHLQCFFQFKVQTKYSTLRRILKVWWKPMKPKATPEDNVVYCSKEGNFVQWGEIRYDEAKKAAGRAAGGQRTADKWEDTLQKIKCGKFDDIDPQIYICHYNAIMAIARRFIEMPPQLNWRDGFPPNLWLYGVAGCGKSRKAWEQFPGAYRKPCNKWWDGFDPMVHKNVVIDDFDESHKVLCHHLKIWADRYPFILEIKGGAIGARPEVIVVTSNWAPGDIWTNPNDLDPILRRFQVINMSPFSKKPRAELVLQDNTSTTIPASAEHRVTVPTPPTADVNGRRLEFVIEDSDEE